MPTEEEMRMYDSNMELDENKDADDPNFRVSTLGPKTDDDMDDAWSQSCYTTSLLGLICKH